jgi:hypothetical protein
VLAEHIAEAKARGAKYDYTQRLNVGGAKFDITSALWNIVGKIDGDMEAIKPGMRAKRRKPPAEVQRDILADATKVVLARIDDPNSLLAEAEESQKALTAEFQSYVQRELREPRRRWRGSSDGSNGCGRVSKISSRRSRRGGF